MAHQWTKIGSHCGSDRGGFGRHSPSPQSTSVSPGGKGAYSIDIPISFLHLSFC